MTKDEILNEIESLENDKDNIQREINDLELDPDEYEDQYDDFLFEVYGYVNLGAEYHPADVLREIDPTAYRCGLNDYVNSIDITETIEYRELQDELEDIENQIIDLKEQLEEYED